MPIEALPNFLPALPEIFLAVAAMVLLILGVFQGEARAAKPTSTRATVVRRDAASMAEVEHPRPASSWVRVAKTHRVNVNSEGP